MRLLLYAPMSEGAGQRLKRVIEELVPQNSIEVYRSIGSLTNRLRQPANDLAIAVLLITSREDLLELLFIRDLLRDLRIVLVLPDRDRDTIAKGHALRPRFLSYTDSDFWDVSAVLKKML